MSEIAISLKNVSKCFRRYPHPVERLKEILLPGKSRADEFWALRDIDLEVSRGQTVGIVGRNGSGKSTLLQIIVGTLTPTAGRVQVNGRISALLELGSGFNPEFTGRQNVFFNGRILGLSQSEIEERFDQIAAFADIGDFLDQPVKTYSSGMYVRLAFSVAINVDPDILIVDEALAVGDARFQHRCMSRINQLRDNGVSILFVSHDSDSVKRLCNHVVVMEKSQIINSGSAVTMTNWYLAFMTVDFDIQKLREMEDSVKLRNGIEQILASKQQELSLLKSNGLDENFISSNTQVEVLDKITQKELIDEQLPRKNQTELPLEFKYFRHGDGNAKIMRVTIKNSEDQEVDFIFLGETVKIDIEVEFLVDQEEYLIGLLIRDRLGTDIIGINTYQEQLKLPKVSKGEKFIYCFKFDMHIKPGIYGICPSVAYGQYAMKWLDWVDNASVIRVIDSEPQRLVFGTYLPPERSVEIIKIL